MVARLLQERVEQADVFHAAPAVPPASRLEARQAEAEEELELVFRRQAPAGAAIAR